MMERGNLDNLAAFAAVANARSFTRAAAELRISTSALSHTIKGLEAALGVRLLQRNSRSVSVTAAGERLLQRLGPALSEIDTALDALHQERDLVSGPVRLTATRHSYETVIRPALARFLGDHPHAEVEVLIDYQFRDIVAERFDAGIRLGEKLEQDMIAVPVSPPLRMAVVASPAYLARHPAPKTPQQLTGHRCVNYRMMASGKTYDWEFEKQGRQLAIKVTGPLTFNEPGLMLDAALDGFGIAYLLQDFVQRHIDDGRLVHLLDSWTPPFPGYFLYYSSRRQVPPTLAAFIEVLREMRR